MRPRLASIGQESQSICRPLTTGGIGRTRGAKLSLPATLEFRTRWPCDVSVPRRGLDGLALDELAHVGLDYCRGGMPCAGARRFLQRPQRR